MTQATLERAIELAAEFLIRANYYHEEDNDLKQYRSTRAAALKRTSMELTKALADLRRPG